MAFRQQPALELSLRYQLSHLLKPPQTFQLCSAWESHWPWDGGQWPLEQSPRGQWVREAKPVTANGLSHCTWSSTIQKNHHFYCTAVPWSNGGDLSVLRLVTTHWTKHSRWHAAQCWTEEQSSILILQCSFNEASHGISVTLSGFIWCCQISSSDPVYLLSHWPQY